MCPICILTSVIYVLAWIIGIFGFTKAAKWIKFKYIQWSGKKCDKCKCREHASN